MRHQKRLRLLELRGSYFLLLIALLLQGGMARAEWIPGFQMESSVGTATCIVVGRLNDEGTLTVTETLRPNLAATEDLTIDHGADYYTGLKKVMAPDAPAEPIEVVAFLQEKRKESWHPVLGRAGIVGLVPEAVYLFDEKAPAQHPEELAARIRSTRIAKQSQSTRASFLASVRAAMAIDDERKRLLTLPAGAGRIEPLMAFLQKYTILEVPNERVNANSSARWTGYYHLASVARSLRPINPNEETILIRKLQESTDLREQLMLLRMVQTIPLTRTAFDTVAEFTQRQRPEAVRHEAIWALRALDTYRAGQYLAQFLTLDEPQLAHVLSCLGDTATPTQQIKFSRNVLSPLSALVIAKRGQDKGIKKDHWNEVNNILLHQLENHAHPRLIPGLYEWAMDTDHVSADRALERLQAVTGIKLPRGDTAWVTWWEKARQVWGQEFELHTADGLRSWLQTYTNSDAATRAILLRIWNFEPEVSEESLLRIASGGTGNTNGQTEAAKDALSFLWQYKRLSPETRKEIVMRFMHIEMEQVPPVNPGSKELKIVANRDFPFPKNTWFNYGYDLIKEDGVPIFRNKELGNSSSFEGSGPKILGTPGGGIGPAGQRISLTIGIEEKDYSRGGILQWTHQWNIEPITLRDLPVQRQ